MELDNDQKKELLTELRTIEPSLKYAPEEGWYDGETETDFQDSCGCYSEYTTDSCRLAIFVKGKLPDDKDARWRLGGKLDNAAEKWAHYRLRWNGCSNCGDDLYVNVHLFKE